MQTTPCGLCFPWANRYASERGGVVVHGLVTEPLSDPPHRYLHAWVEDNGYVYDWQTMEAGHGGIYRGRGWPREAFYDVFQPEHMVRYSWEQALANLVRQGHHGPWEETLEEFAYEVEPNPGTRYPWDEHVYPLAEQSMATIKDLVRRDREMFRKDPSLAAMDTIREGLMFRSGRPRIGEPLFRSETQVKFRAPNIHCGRGTGHLGTGLYFFGTLSSATGVYWSGRDWPRDNDEILDIVRGVYIVDISGVDESKIYIPRNDEKTNDLHGFGKALICWPDHYEQYLLKKAESNHIERELSRVQQIEGDREYRGEPVVATIKGDELQFEDALDALYELRDVLRETRKKERNAEKLARADVRRMRFDGPRMHVSKTIPEGEQWTEPPEAVRPAIDAYLADLEHPLVPGYHPMTYYMTQIGYELVVHGSWDQLNSGDIGNIWYPFEVE